MGVIVLFTLGVLTAVILGIAYREGPTAHCTIEDFQSSDGQELNKIEEKCIEDIKKNKRRYQKIEAQLKSLKMEQNLLKEHNDLKRTILEVMERPYQHDTKELPPETTPEDNTESVEKKKEAVVKESLTTETPEEDWYRYKGLKEVEEKKEPQETYIGKFHLSRYYRPLENQQEYHWGNFDREFFVNCSGSCEHTADGTPLSEKLVGKVLACPPNFPLGTKLKLVYEYGFEIEATCHDRGGAIKNKRLDLWSGIGQDGYNNIFKKNPTPTPAGKVEVYKIL